MSGLSPREPAGLTPGEVSWPEGWIEFRRERNRPVVAEPFTGPLAGAVRTGVLFPGRSPRPVLVLGWTLGLLFCAGSVILLWGAVIRDRVYPAVIGVLVLAVIGAFFTGSGVIAWRQSRRDPWGLVLTPEAVCGPDGKSVLPWDVIAEIRCKVVTFSWRRRFLFHKGRRRPLTPQSNYLTVSVTSTDRVEGLGPWIRRLAPRVEQPVILRLATRVFAGNPAAVFHALRHYHTHPEDRPELGNGAALARIKG